MYSSFRMDFGDFGDDLECPVCLSSCTDLISPKCGHTFCWQCFDRMVDSDEDSEDEDNLMVAFSCPVCNEEYHPPKNRKLETGPVLCTYCDIPTPAIKTCLTCETSFCHKHLRNHNETTRDHKLSDPIASFTDRKCSLHNEALRYYCQEDKLCICTSCVVIGGHETHEVELIEEAARKLKSKFAPSEMKSQMQQITSRLQNLQNHVMAEKQKADDLSQRVMKLFTDMRSHLEGLQEDILTEISRQEDLMFQINPQIERQLCELHMKIQQVEELCKNDPLTFLKQEIDTGDIILNQGDITSDKKRVGCLEEDMISHILTDGLKHFSNCVKDLKENLKFAEPKKSMMSLDKDTAPNDILIDWSSQVALRMNTTEDRPDNPKKFECHQVLSNERFTGGKHYWEVKVAGAEEWLIGVAAESIERKSCGNESIIGYNEKSWSLGLQKKITACHNNIKTIIDSKCAVKRIGIFLDYDGGRLSFYQMCGLVRHLHTFIANFTEPLYAAFYVFEGSSVSLVSP